MTTGVGPVWLVAVSVTDHTARVVEHRCRYLRYSSTIFYNKSLRSTPNGNLKVANITDGIASASPCDVELGRTARPILGDGPVGRRAGRARAGHEADDILRCWSIFQANLYGMEESASTINSVFDEFDRLSSAPGHILCDRFMSSSYINGIRNLCA